MTSITSPCRNTLAADCARSGAQATQVMRPEASAYDGLPYGLNGVPNPAPPATGTLG